MHLDKLEILDICKEIIIHLPNHVKALINPVYKPHPYFEAENIPPFISHGL